MPKAPVSAGVGRDVCGLGALAGAAKVSAKRVASGSAVKKPKATKEPARVLCCFPDLLLA